ncbi:uncharacterized protein SEPMUDRAFT_146578 [Sphaerulina musiva SO2202]|uniref:Uncharacterized protein n=1 Tax=Sphaerulina musiva (strain SO2202) TaxID=692275 RepID=N1QN95_SPHMS|nr:uncharacterized protein SEPMUDRAFT_146578 [Sphaerulina musiva SO2202]EMF17598.1 hypothetical protein SEPMUDRAFT_146578 [Sphaerulina musiva SO2202]
MIRNIEADGTRSGHLHLRNNIRCGDDHVIPLQFVYDAADCRTFYKIDSMLSGVCIPESTGHRSSVLGSTFYASPT